MAYQSDLGTDPLIIDDSNASRFVEQWRDEGRAFGMTPRDYRVAPFGSASRPAVDLSMGPILERSQFADAIKRADEARNTPDDFRKSVADWIENQSTWSFCWGFGCVKAIEITYAMSGYEVPHLNPFPTAYRGKNGRNQGGWAEEMLRYVDQFGIPTHDVWKGNQADMSMWKKPEVIASANRHKVTAMLELPRGSLNALITSLTHPKHPRPCSIGLGWWGHLICAVRAVALDGNRFGVLAANSWDRTWGLEGMVVLAEGKAEADEQIRIERVKPVLAT